MTQLTLLQIGASYGDVLTTTNNGQGLDSTLRNLQDGLGNNSPITIATNAVNFSRLGGQTFQLDNVALTATATALNNLTAANPSFGGTGAVTVPCGTTAERPFPGAEGMFRINSDTNLSEWYVNGAWHTS